MTTAATQPERTIEKRLGEWLLNSHVISESQLELAVQERQRQGRDLGPVLEDLGFADQATLSRFLAEEAQTESVELLRTPIEARALECIPYELAKGCRAMPLRLNESTQSLTAALADPFDVMAIDTLERKSGFYIEVVTAPERDILEALDRYYLEQQSILQTIEELMKSDIGGSPDDAMEEDAPLIRLVDQIFARALELGASDIHVEPEEKILRIRLRVDGVLHQEVLIPKKLESAVVARLKILGDLDLTEHRLPQDGRASFALGRHKINLRVSTLPTYYGENVVLRILDASKLNLQLSALGFSGNDFKKMEHLLASPNGVILVTGPTGSGKTTTLYSALKSVISLERSVFTLEDPVEYQLPIIRQTQIREDIGMTFAAGLRALLRQDPDVIMVGETRDTETAQLMVRAALTGHLVFSTLHTNSAADAIPRLLDMGIEPYLLPAGLKGILGQRLVRRVCTACQYEAEDLATAFRHLGVTPPPDTPARLTRGRGCVHCNGTGYRGRTPIYEVLVIDEHFHDAILERAGSRVFESLARESGFTTLFEDGIAKVAAGQTTPEEVLRVAPRPTLDGTPNGGTSGSKAGPSKDPEGQSGPSLGRPAADFQPSVTQSTE